MREKDVDNILDIPNIEKWLDVIFTLSCYEAGDKVLYYEADEFGVTCDVNISVDEHPRLIEGQKKLSDLIMLGDIGMFELSVGLQTKEWDNELGFYMRENIEKHQSHWYRPFLAKEEREY